MPTYGKVLRKNKFSWLAVAIAITAVILIAAVTVVVTLMLGSKDEPSSSVAGEPESSLSSSGESLSSSSENSVSSSVSSSEVSESSVPIEKHPIKSPLIGNALPESPKADKSYFTDCLFIGDSISDGLPLYGIMGDAAVVSSKGINIATIFTTKAINNETQTVLEAVRDIKKPNIYILMGANGVAFHDKTYFTKKYSELIDKLRELHPDSKIIVQSILPVTAKKSADPQYANEKINDYNTALAAMCDQQEVYYLNVAEALKDEYGNLPDEASPVDGMHFGKKYYLLWEDYVLSHVLPASEYSAGAASGAPAEGEIAVSASSSSSQGMILVKPAE